MENIKLTKQTATELIRRIIPCHLELEKDDTPPEVAIYRTAAGRNGLGLEITCENDWYDHNGLIRLTISDGEQRIVQYYNPDTLERDNSVV